MRDVYETLLEAPQIAYTTVMTMMRVLEKKGHVKTQRENRAFVYRPSRPERQVVRSMVREFVDRVFNGSAQPLLVHLVEDRRLSPKEARGAGAPDSRGRVMDVLHPANLLAWALQAGVVVLVAAPLPRLLGMWSPRVAHGVLARRARRLPAAAAAADVGGARGAGRLRSRAAADVVGTPAQLRGRCQLRSPKPVLEASRPLADRRGRGARRRASSCASAWLGLGVFTVGRLRRSARRALAAAAVGRPRGDARGDRRGVPRVGHREPAGHLRRALAGRARAAQLRVVPRARADGDRDATNCCT